VERINDEEDPKSKKSIVLKSNIDSDYTNSDDDMDDEELAFMIKKGKKIQLEEAKHVEFLEETNRGQ